MHQPPPPQQQPQQPPRPRHGGGARRTNKKINFCKLLLVGFLGGLALFLQITIWTLESLRDRFHELEQADPTEIDKVVQKVTATDYFGRYRMAFSLALLTTGGDDHHENDSFTTIQNIKKKKNKNSDSGSSDGDTQTGKNDENGSTDAAATDRSTIRASKPTEPSSLHLQRLYQTYLMDSSSSSSSPIQPRPHGFGTSRKTQAHAFWNVAAHVWLKAWDPNIVQPMDSLTTTTEYSSSSTRTTIPSGNFAADTTASGDGEDTATAAEEEANWPSNWTVFALQKAAETGHATAQFHVANAYAAGFWPSLQQPTTTTQTDYYYAADSHHHHHHHSPSQQLLVQESWTLPKSKQQQKAWLYWHMAAVNGHVEAAMAMAHRIESVAAPNTAAASTTTTASTTTPATPAKVCSQVLPYMQAAASGILDQLETDIQSRAKVPPALDKHVLHQIYLHGGTASKLDYYNKADESPEALQFYHLRATSVTTTAAERDAAGRSSSSSSNSISSSSSSSSSKSNGGTSPEQAAAAAYTLGNYYQHGVRGVAQNLTLAAAYYEMAALQNHWEAAGQVGKFYLWGIGVPQDAYKAFKFFKIGVPTGFANCQYRYNNKANKNRKTNNNIAGNTGEEGDHSAESLSMCESNCMNGMGLLRLLGLPHLAPLDVDTALDFLQLAKDQGNVDAVYNLAMINLGWKLHWKVATGTDINGKAIYFAAKEDEDNADNTVAKADKDGKEIDKLFGRDTGKNKKDKKKSHIRHNPTRSDYQSIITDLTTAAGKGHVQARFRLGMMYATGIKIPDPAATSGAGAAATAAGIGSGMITVVQKDCDKALRQFRWIVENVSPDRARRLRRAYKQFVAGQKAHSLRNYLAAAETGSDVALLNAAFLLEQGTCLGMSSTDCAKASVRLWKHAAEKGHPEASLRVGDTYYYGRFRKDASVAQVGPFGWVHYVLHPEELLVHLYKTLTAPPSPSKDITTTSTLTEPTTPSNEECSADEDGTEPGTCVSRPQDEASKPTADDDEQQQQHTSQSDLEMAAHFYRLAADTAESPRANFNLGFLYEWGLGLKQDFPLAKRHYDLAVSGVSKEAELPVVIALVTLSIHEKLVKLYMAITDYIKETYEEAERRARGNDDASAGYNENVPSGSESPSREPVPHMDRNKGLTEVDVIMSHLLSWESAVIFVLTILLFILLRHRQTRQRQ